MSVAFNLPPAAGHIWKRALEPVRRVIWNNRSAPFWHTGEKGIQFELYPGEVVDYYIYTHGLFEKRALHLIEALLPRRRTALDVGANIGNHALFFAKIFKSVHAFEPNPRIVKRLIKNKEKNAAANLHVHAVGLSEQSARLPFRENRDGNAGASRFVEAEAEATCRLEVVNADAFVNERAIGDIDLVKLDVEGHELPALRGLRETLKTHQPVICFEYGAQNYDLRFFDNFRAALPGYQFYECVLRAHETSRLKQWRDYFRNRGLPRLKPIIDVEPKHYDNIFAFPAGFDKTLIGTYAERPAASMNEGSDLT